MFWWVWGAMVTHARSVPLPLVGIVANFRSCDSTEGGIAVRGDWNGGAGSGQPFGSADIAGGRAERSAGTAETRGEMVSLRKAAGSAEARGGGPTAVRSASDVQGTASAAMVSAVGCRAGGGAERPRVVPSLPRAVAGGCLARSHDLVPVPQPLGRGGTGREVVCRVRAAAGAAWLAPEAWHDDRCDAGRDAVPAWTGRRSRRGSRNAATRGSFASPHKWSSYAVPS